MRKPWKFAIIFIIVHWAILFPVVYVIDGHPPIPMMILFLPSMIIDALIKLDQERFIILPIIVNTLFYGAFGYLVGRIYEKLLSEDKKETVPNEKMR